MGWDGEVGFSIIATLDDFDKFIKSDLAAAEFQHGCDQGSHHSPQKPVGPDMENQWVSLAIPMAFGHVALEGLSLGLSLGKRGEVGICLY